VIDAYLLQYSGFLNALESLHCCIAVVCLLGHIVDLDASEPEWVRQRADAACRVKTTPLNATHEFHAALMSR
jgi:hypothetical protein